MRVGEYACWASMIICFILAMAYDNLLIGFGSLFFATILVFYWNVTKDAVSEKTE